MSAGARIPAVRRGALLLEVVLALAIFVMSGLAILSLVGQGEDSLLAIREQVKAADLARSAMAQLEAGLADPIALNGPVREWTDDEAGGPAGFDDAPPRTTGWALKIETEPSEYAGLTRVSVTAYRDRGQAEQGGVVGVGGPESFTLHQLVNLSRSERPSQARRTDR